MNWNTGPIDAAAHPPPKGDADPPDARPRRSPIRSIGLRVVLSIGMLGLLVWQLPDVHWRDLGPSWTGSSVWWLVAAGALFFCAFMLSTVRWQRVLAAMRPAPGFRLMFTHFMAGQFVSNVLPSAVGGDVLRIARLGRDLGGDHPSAFASVTIERMTGWLVMPLISFVTFLSVPRLRDLGHASTLAYTIAGITLAALVVVLLLASNRRFGSMIGAATGWRSFLAAVHIGVDALRRDPRAALGVLVAGTAFQLLQCVAVAMIAIAIGLGDQVTLAVALAFFPVVAIAQNLPVGIGGLGVRESLFVVFFKEVHAPKGLSITLGLLVYGLTIVTSSVGAPAFVLGGRRSQNPHMVDVTEAGADA